MNAGKINWTVHRAVSSPTLPSEWPMQTWVFKDATNNIELSELKYVVNLMIFVIKLVGRWK